MQLPPLPRSTFLFSFSWIPCGRWFSGGAEGPSRTGTDRMSKVSGSVLRTTETVQNLPRNTEQTGAELCKLSAGQTGPERTERHSRDSGRPAAQSPQAHTLPAGFPAFQMG